MAVAVPLVMMAAGASTTAIIGTSLVLAATGLSAKIDKAAGKVFGKDLVTIGNIAGAAFMAFGNPAAVFGGVQGAAGAAGAAAPAAGTAPFDVAGAAGGMGQAAAGAPGMALDPTGLAPTLGQAPQVATGQAPGILDKIGSAFGKMGDRTQSALIQVGGNMLAGAAQGAAAAKQAEAERRERRRQEDEFMSGSGLTEFAPGLSRSSTTTTPARREGALAYYRKGR